MPLVVVPAPTALRTDGRCSSVLDVYAVFGSVEKAAIVRRLVDVVVERSAATVEADAALRAFEPCGKEQLGLFS